MLCQDKMVKEKHIEELAKQIDKDNSQSISFDEFNKYMLESLGFYHSSMEEDLEGIMNFLREEFP